MRFFVFGREVIPKWFAEAINKEEIVYEYKENRVVGFRIIKTEDTNCCFLPLITSVITLKES